MTPAQQLPLTAPASAPRAQKQLTYRGVAVSERDVKNPALRGMKALELYTGTPKPPAWIICHPEDAAAIGAEVQGVPVIATGTSRGLYLLGPIDV